MIKPPTTNKRQRSHIKRRSVSLVEQRRRSTELSDGYPRYFLEQNSKGLASSNAKAMKLNDSAQFEESVKRTPFLAQKPFTFEEDIDELILPGIATVSIKR